MQVPTGSSCLSGVVLWLWGSALARVLWDLHVIHMELQAPHTSLQLPSYRPSQPPPVTSRGSLPKEQGSS